jgi:hypothetical protein
VNLKLLGAAALTLACVPNVAALGQAPEGQTITPLPSPPIIGVGAANAKESAASPPQVPATGAPPAVTTPPCCKLAALMPVELEIVTAASSKTSRQGEQIEIRLAEPVTVDGRVVLPAGTAGTAEVIQVSHRAIGGKPGELTLGLPCLIVGGQRIGLKRLRYGPSSGADRTQQATIAMALVGIAGGLITGGSVDIKSGTRMNAVVTTDTFIPINPESASKE